MTAPSGNISLDAPAVSGISSAVDCSTSPKIVMFLLLLRGWSFVQCFFMFLCLYFMGPYIIMPFEIEFLPSSVQGHADLFIYCVNKFRRPKLMRSFLLPAFLFIAPACPTNPPPLPGKDRYLLLMKLLLQSHILNVFAWSCQKTLKAL